MKDRRAVTEAARKTDPVYLVSDMDQGGRAQVMRKGGSTGFAVIVRCLQQSEHMKVKLYLPSCFILDRPKLELASVGMLFDVGTE